MEVIVNKEIKVKFIKILTVPNWFENHGISVKELEELFHQLEMSLKCSRETFNHYVKSYSVNVPVNCYRWSLIISYTKKTHAALSKLFDNWVDCIIDPDLVFEVNEKPDGFKISFTVANLDKTLFNGASELTIIDCFPNTRLDKYSEFISNDILVDSEMVIGHVKPN